MKPVFSLLPFSIAFSLLFAGCGKKNEFVSPPPPEVTVQNPLVGETTVYLEFAGRTEASARVEIRARVKGFLKSTEFIPGQFVKEGQLLFTIEPEQFEAAVRTAKGNLAKAEADLEIATANWKRRKQASGSGAVSELDVLSAEADVKAATAVVSIAEAAVADAERDLSYTRIHAPMAGRISSARVDLGNLVGADPTLLTEIVSVKPIYVNLEFNERDLLPYLQDMPNEENPTGGSGTDGSAKKKELELVLSDGSKFGETGRLDFVDNTIDTASGTIKSRAVFPNKEGLLADGLFGRIRIPEVFPNAVQVPASVIQRDIGGSYVLLAGADNKVIRRVVNPTKFSLGSMKIVQPFDEATGTGLQGDDRLIVSNLQRAREGIVVKPVEPKPAAAPEVPEEGSAAKEASAE